MSSFDSAAVREYLLELQDLIVARLEQVDGKLFRRDNWDKGDGCGGGPSTALGTGVSCILEEGNVLERDGVAFSHVMGDKMPPAATAHRPELAGRRW
ncbi:MAG: coproporphyrinogen III oxidase [Gallionella sp.]|nr:coproporphyrinogen III oxidase [Gallionella sp.]